MGPVAGRARRKTGALDGAEAADQSALNPVYLLGSRPDPARFSVFGPSDERFHVRGGNDRLPAAIIAHLGNVERGHALLRIAATTAGRYELTFDRGGGTTTVVSD